jgi:AraC-like DNA-binding protein
MLGLTLMGLPFLIAHVIIGLVLRESYNLNSFTILLVLPLLLAGIYLMLFPSIVYGLQPPKMGANQVADPPATPGASLPGPSAEPAAVLPVADGEQAAAYQRYQQQLEAFMQEQKPYLNQNLTIHQLADASGIPTYILSMLLNRHIGQSFKAWLNGYRIEAFMAMAEQPEAKSYTLESMGKAAGFGSRVTLINAFKKQTGLTPSQYLRQKNHLDLADLD